MKKTKIPSPAIPSDHPCHCEECTHDAAIHANTGSPHPFGIRDDEDIKSLKDQLSSIDDKFKRTLADYQNLERNQHQSRLLEKGKIISKFLPLLDGLELTHQHTQDPVTEMMVKEFKKVLNELGVSLIDSEKGRQFNSLSMDCVEVVAGEKDKVVKIVQPGYQLGEVVLRPARVEVGNGSVGAHHDAPSTTD